MANNAKVLVLGVDAMDPLVTRRFMRESIMPNMEKLMKMSSCREDLIMLGGHPIDDVLSPIKEAEGWAAAHEGAKEATFLFSEGLVRRPALILKNEQGIYDRVAVYKKKKDIHYIITVIIIFGFRFLPNFGPVTDEGMVLLGAFIGAVYGWSFINMLWPSILAFSSIGLELGMAKVVAAGLGSTITWMLVFFYIIIGVLNEYKITDNLVAAILTRKFIIGKPWILFATIIIGTFLCAMLSGFGTLVIFLAFSFKMCEILKVEPYSKLSVMLGSL